MDFELTEEQKQVKALVRDFCKREVDVDYLWELSDQKVENLRDRMPYDLLKKAHDVGLRQFSVPVEYGGGGAGCLLRVIAGEEAGYSGGPLGRLLSIPWKLLADIDSLASKELKDEIFTQFMNDPTFFLAGSITEADAGTDTFLPYDEPGVGMKTFAYMDGDEWVINGEKHFCSAGGVANVILLTARTDKAGPISKSCTQFLVPTNTPGFSVVRINEMIAEDVTGNVDCLYDNVRIPDRYRLSPVNEGYRPMATHLAGKLLHTACLTGLSQRLYEQTKEYAKTRIQGGKPIYEHLNIGPLVVEMGLRIEAVRLMHYRAAWQYEQEEKLTPTPNPVWGYYCNYYYKQMALRCCEIAAEVFGGAAALKEMPVEHYVRFLYSMIHGGSTGNMNLIKCMHYI